MWAAKNTKWFAALVNIDILSKCIAVFMHWAVLKN